MKKIESIIIFGGGTSGWLTAAYMTKNLAAPIRITLIEDASAGPIGVGEGTQPLTAKFLYECGIEAKDWMKPSKAAFKYGVELVGWNDEPYFVDNDAIQNYMATTSLFTSKYFINKPYKEFADWYPAYRLAKENVSPKLSEALDHNFGQGPDGYGAVHFSAYDIITTLKNIIGNRINYVDAKITQVETNDNGISALIDESGNRYSSDLYLDCSGFNSTLLEKTLGAEYVSYKDSGWLFNDRAVAIPTPYTNPESECHPYTKATAMNAGWRWTIPTYHRVGNGYVYSSDYITPEEAEQELRESLNDFTSPAKHLKMRCGTHKAIAVKNVCAVGLAAGFVEPLEATGITFTTAVARSVTDILNGFQGQWTDQSRDFINQGWYEMSIEILTFVWSHYYFSNKNDTKYWQDIKKLKITDLPTDAQFILSKYYPVLGDFVFFSPQSMFSSQQWFSMIHAGGGYKSNAGKVITAKEKEYMKIFLDQGTARVDAVIENFPNHYKFLKEWYDGWTVE